MIESVNSVIRTHINIHKGIPEWFGPLFTFYWNNRKFSRGKRKGFSPSEILFQNKNDEDWLETLVRKFPYYKLNCSLPPIPQWSPALQWKKTKLPEIAKLDKDYIAFSQRRLQKLLEVDNNELCHIEAV